MNIVNLTFLAGLNELFNKQNTRYYYFSNEIEKKKRRISGHWITKLQNTIDSERKLYSLINSKKFSKLH